VGCFFRLSSLLFYTVLHANEANIIIYTVVQKTRHPTIVYWRMWVAACMREGQRSSLWTFATDRFCSQPPTFSRRRHMPVAYWKAGHILSVESNQNVESKLENVESKIWKCGAHTRSVFLLFECNACLCVMLTCSGCRLRRLCKCLHSFVQTTSKKYFENAK